MAYNLDLEIIKINMIINFVRDYYTLKDCTNIGVLFVDNELHIESLNGMSGFSRKIDIDNLLEENDPNIIFKILLSTLKNHQEF